MIHLYSGDWYNGQSLTSWREALQTRDRATIRLGIARVRQLRIKDGPYTAALFRSFPSHCADYTRPYKYKAFVDIRFRPSVGIRYTAHYAQT